MPPRTLFAKGAIGEIVKQIQAALIAQGLGPPKADGVFGDNTEAALRKFQASKSLPATGTVTDNIWPALMDRPLPSAADRSLQLTAAFESHGFRLAVGNFDRALLTWGVIGFTMKSGQVQSIVLAVNQANPDLVKQAFGGQTAEVLQLMNETAAFQMQWANERTTKSKALAEPWRSMFAAFGSFPEVQQEQLRHVRQNYMDPAIQTARKLGLTSELGLALCFDAQVQNGGIKRAAMKTLLQGSSSEPRSNQPHSIEGPGELHLRQRIANAVADSAKAAWRDDVRRRKLAIATGQGTVHGHDFVLENWGLSGDIPAIELLATTGKEIPNESVVGVSPATS